MVASDQTQPTTTPAAVPGPPVASPTPVARRVAQVLLWVAAVGAVGAAVGAIGDVLDADGVTRVVQTWRGYGLAVFAGLFAMLALRPRGYRGVWGLVILNKLALTVTALLYRVHGGIAGTGTIIVSDGALTVLLIVACLLARPWIAGAARPAPEAVAR